MEAKEYLEQLVANARVAQAEFETYPQEKVDAACRAVCKAVYDNAEMLAHMAVDETRMGRYDSKIAKCRNKSKTVGMRTPRLPRSQSPSASSVPSPRPRTRSSPSCTTPPVR